MLYSCTHMATVVVKVFTGRFHGVYSLYKKPLAKSMHQCICVLYATLTDRRLRNGHPRPKDEKINFVYYPTLRVPVTMEALQ